MTGLRKIACALALSATLAWASPADASDAVVDWNLIASNAIAAAGAAGRPGPALFLDFAMVHAAVYDAVQAIEKRYQPYTTEIPHADGSPAAATAKAAYDVLVKLFPAQADGLTTTYDNYLADNGIAPDDPGILVGQQAAAGLLNLRMNDGSFPPSFPPFVGGDGPGEWRPTPSYQPGPPPSGAPMAAPWLAKVLPFALKDPSQRLADPPPPLTSARYAREYEEVKKMGARFNSKRTPEQTDLAYFWADNFAIQWNRAMRVIATDHVSEIAESARMFALTSLSAADGVIGSWYNKIYYNFWRPVTAIQLGDMDGNHRTYKDPAWEPLINTPNYPDYTSGANTVTGAITRALELYFGTDKMTFSVTSLHPLVQQGTRTFERFSDASLEVVEARILLGIHFRFADAAARREGRRTANWVFRHYLKPVKHHGHDKVKGEVN
jgi:hypothetical protein